MRTAVLVLLCSTTLTGGGGQTQFPAVAAGHAVRLVFPLPAGDADSVSVRVKPGSGVKIEGATRLTREGVAEIAFTATVPPDTPPGLFTIATIVVKDHASTSETHCYIWVLGPEPMPTVGPLLPVVAAVPQTNAKPPLQQPVLPPPAAVPGLPTPAPITAPRQAQAASGFKGVVYAGATELGLSGRSQAEAGYGLDLSGRVGDGTQVHVVYVHGWNPGLSPVFRYGMHESRGHVRIRAPSWSFEGGEIRQESALAGVMAPADGVALQRTRGLFIGSLTAARPKYFGGGWGGHLFQGSAGVGFPNGSVSLIASDLARPVRSSRVLANSEDADEDPELVAEDLQRVGALLSRENRIRSGGLETRLRFGSHNIIARGGWVDLVDITGREASGLAASGSYSLRTHRASVNAFFRTSPPALPGMALAGDQATLGGRIRVAGPISLTARSYWHQTALLGRADPTTSAGGSTGIEYSTAPAGARFYLQGNYRETRFLSATVTRSMTAGLRLPLGMTGFDTVVELGEAEDGRRRRRIAIYRGSFYVEGAHAAFMFSGSYRDYGISSPRLSLDVSGSLGWRGATLEAGTGLSRAGIFGDVFNGWATVEVPLPGDLAILLGADYDRWSFQESPYLIFLMDDEPAPPWRFTFNVKKRLSIPIAK